VACSRTAGDEREEAISQYAFGQALITEARHEEAVPVMRRAADLLRRLGFPAGEASALLDLARAQLALNRPEEAIAPLARAAPAFAEDGDRDRQGAALFDLGRALATTGRDEEAAAVALSCAALYRGMRRPDLEQRALLGIGTDIANAGRAEYTLPLFRRLHEAHVESGDPEQQTWSLVLWAGALVDAGHYAEAVPANRRAVDICRATGNATFLSLALSQLEKAERGLRQGNHRLP
jgi:hypothetical protein